MEELQEHQQVIQASLRALQHLLAKAAAFNSCLDGEETVVEDPKVGCIYPTQDVSSTTEMTLQF